MAAAIPAIATSVSDSPMPPSLRGLLRETLGDRGWAAHSRTGSVGDKSAGGSIGDDHGRSGGVAVGTAPRPGGLGPLPAGPGLLPGGPGLLPGSPVDMVGSAGASGP